MYVLLKISDFFRNSINLSTALFWNYLLLNFYRKKKLKGTKLFIFLLLITLFAIVLDSIVNYFDIVYGYPLKEKNSIFYNQKTE